MSSRASLRRVSPVVVSALSALVLVACATAETLDENGGEGGGGAGGAAGTGGGAQRDAGTSGFPDASRDSGASAFPDAARVDASREGGSGGAGGSGGSGGAGGSGGSGGTVPCTASNACSSATGIGSVSGDTGSGHLTTSGTTSQWVQFRVTEDDSGITSKAVRAFLTLSSPQGTNFDLYVRSGGSSPVCGAVDDQSTSTVGNDTASVQRDDSGLFGLSNGSDDTFWASAEIRWVSGPCSPGAKWTLTVDGN